MKKALWREISDKIQYKVISREETQLDAWGNLIKPSLKYSFRDVQYAIELTVIEMKKRIRNTKLKRNGGKK